MHLLLKRSSVLITLFKNHSVPYKLAWIFLQPDRIQILGRVSIDGKDPWRQDNETEPSPAAQTLVIAIRVDAIQDNTLFIIWTVCHMDFVCAIIMAFSEGIPTLWDVGNFNRPVFHGWKFLNNVHLFGYLLAALEQSFWDISVQGVNYLFLPPLGRILTSGMCTNWVKFYHMHLLLDISRFILVLYFVLLTTTVLLIVLSRNISFSAGLWHGKRYDDLSHGICKGSIFNAL